MINDVYENILETDNNPTEMIYEVLSFSSIKCTWICDLFCYKITTFRYIDL